MTNNNSNNKSMFLYTALIFIVAVLLIIISFFGQTNLEKKQPKPEATELVSPQGITEKASILSEENKNLIEENTRLKEENQTLIEKSTNNDILLAANGYLTLGDNTKALELIMAVNYDTLSADQKIIYDSVKKSLDEAENK